MEVLNIIAVITDVDKICRTCLTEKEDADLQCLYDNTVDNMLWKLSGLIKPVLGDGLPSYICKQCLAQLKTALAFKEQCQKSEVRLRHLLLIAQPQKSNFTLKELLLTNLEDTVKLERLDTRSTVLDASVQTDKSVFKKRKKRKEGKNWSSPYWSSDDELFIDAPDDEFNFKNDEYETCTAWPNKKAEIKEDEVDNQKESSITEPPHRCKKCKKAFRSATGLRVHLVKHGKKLKCEVCGKKFGLIKHLNKHTKLHKDYKPHVCKVCKKAFAATGNLSKHMRVHGGEKRHLCITCGRRFFEPGHLAVHMRTHTGEKPIICNVCDKRFADPHGLVAHNKIHTGERNYECKICGKRFAHSFVLTAHNRIHTGEKPYRCSICGASYATSSYLTIHKRTHTHEKPFSCESCPKAFVSRCALVAHNMTHTGEKRFQCNVCGKRVARAADLNIHMRSHTGERPYGCDQCPKRYHTSSNLSAHKRTHLGIKNHICSICKKAFGDARTLKGHTRIHTGEKPYVCHICGNRYSQSGQLAAHRKTHVNQPEVSKPNKQSGQKTHNDLAQASNTNAPLESLIVQNPSTPSEQLIMQQQTVVTPVRFIPVLDSNIQSEQLVQPKIQQHQMEPVAQFIPVLKLDSSQPNFHSDLGTLVSQLKGKSDVIDPNISLQLQQVIPLKVHHDQTELLGVCTETLTTGHQVVHQSDGKQQTIDIFIE